MSDKEEFEQHWNNFITAFRGKLLTQAKKQTLSYPLVNLLFSNEVSSWGTEYELNGRWLNKFVADHPEKGQLIQEILLKDMSLTEIKTAKEFPISINYIAPVTGAIAGLGISRYLGAGIMGQSLSTLLPALVLYPLARTFSETKKQNATIGTIDAYLDQLEKYKLSIESVLNSGVG